MPTPEVLIPALLGNIHFRQRHRLTLQPCTAENLADPNALIDEDIEKQVLQEISAEQGLQADLDKHVVQPLLDLMHVPIHQQCNKIMQTAPFSPLLWKYIKVFLATQT